MAQLPEYPGAAAFVRAEGYHVQARTIRRVVIHCTSGGPSADRTAAYFASGADGSKASAHFVIGQDGTVIQCVRLADVAYHAHAANVDSVGIEHCAHLPGMPPTPAQYDASARLVAWLCAQYAIPVDRQHIQAHHEADPATTHQVCPEGDGWVWGELMARLTGRG